MLYQRVPSSGTTTFERSLAIATTIKSPVESPVYSGTVTLGLLFPVDNVEAGTAKVRQLLEDAALGESLVKRGGDRLESEFSREKIVGDYRELFERLRRGGAT